MRISDWSSDVCSSDLDAIDALLLRHGIPDAPIHLRISGCPNGCSRPYLGEIALVGKAPGRYNLMLGADHRGQRLNTLYRENIVEAEILDALDPLLADYAGNRAQDEGFGDFLVRRAIVAPPDSRGRAGIPIEGHSTEKRRVGKGGGRTVRS